MKLFFAGFLLIGNAAFAGYPSTYTCGNNLQNTGNQLDGKLSVKIEYLSAKVEKDNGDGSVTELYTLYKTEGLNPGVYSPAEDESVILTMKPELNSVNLSWVDSSNKVSTLYEYSCSISP